MLTLPRHHYNIIYADPPWQYTDKANAGKRGASHKYACMPVADICALPVANIAGPDCLLAMWWTGPFMREALAVADAWGFKFKTATGFTWVKTTKHGKLAFNMGSYTRSNAENCLFAVRGKARRVDAGVPQIIVAPMREHSRKPDEARDRLVRLMGDRPRVELFARGRYAGWDCWGDEVEGNKAGVCA